MYTPADRQNLFHQIVAFLNGSPDIEGLLQIGSGASGWPDIYSDIDLMAGCCSASGVVTAGQGLSGFFTDLGACHIETRAWTPTALGLSAYFENGLSVDLSYMPTPELPIRSSQWKLIFAKTDAFADAVNTAARHFTERANTSGLDDSIHYRFIQELRYAEIAMCRQNYIFADVALSRARQLLLSVETVLEGKKLHQFKAYNTLSQPFLRKLEHTYPQTRTKDGIRGASACLLALYQEVVRQCDFLSFDRNLLKLLNGFDQP